MNQPIIIIHHEVFYLINQHLFQINFFHFLLLIIIHSNDHLFINISNYLVSILLVPLTMYDIYYQVQDSHFIITQIKFIIFPFLKLHQPKGFSMLISHPLRMVFILIKLLIML